MTRLRIRVSAALCALTLCSCGGGHSGVSAAAYVHSVCGTLATWDNDVRAAGGKLQAANSAANSLAQGKEQYVSFLDALVAATDQAKRALSSAGVPAVSGGKQVQNALVQAFTRVSSSLAQAAARARSIPTTNAGSYQAAAAGVTGQVRQSLSGLTSITPERNAQLRAAAARDRLCRALGTGTA